MRRWVLIPSSMMLVWSGCALLDRYDYSQYHGSGSTSDASSSSGADTSSSGIAGNGAGGMNAGGAGGMAGAAGQGGVGGELVCVPDVCNDGIPPTNCGEVDCQVSADAQYVFGDDHHQAIKTMIATGTGGLVLGGNYAGTLDFKGAASPLTNNNASALYPFVAKLDADGNGLLADGLQSGGVTNGVAMDSDGTIYGTGVLYPSSGIKKVFVNRFGTGGWEAQIVGADPRNESAGIAYDGGSNLFTAAVFGGTMTTPSCPEITTSVAGMNSADTIIMQFTTGGSCTWAMKLQDVIARSIFANSSIVAVGGIYSGIPAPASLPGAPSTSGSASFVTVFDASSTHDLLRKFYMVPVGSGTISLINIAIDPKDQQSIYITARFVGSYDYGGSTLTSTNGGNDPDLLVVKIGPDGNVVWAQRFGGPGEQVPFSITPYQNAIYISGTTEASMGLIPNTNAGTLCNASKCMFLLKLSPNTGFPVWGRTFGDKEQAADPTAFSAASKNQFWLGGGWSSPIQFETTTTTLDIAGGQDIVLAKFGILP